MDRMSLTDAKGDAINTNLHASELIFQDLYKIDTIIKKKRYFLQLDILFLWSWITNLQSPLYF